MTIGVLLSGCGVYDGAEIQESILTLLAIEEIGAKVQCISLDQDQHHVINHLTGEEMNESRNMLIESARIARGDIKNISDITPKDLDALVIPGGFGSAKNFTKWAFLGPDGEILPEIKLLLVNLVNVGKPIAALCVSPVVMAKALEDSGISVNMTIGSNKEKSPYDIDGFSSGLESTGATTTMKTIREINIDHENKIITAPCYMMNATILEVRKNIRSAIEALRDLL
ncbi:MAG: isoprenoid biosynthesis glyoxalase ElbB [Crocinitomicaceae bacterium]|nr:isoprenoid biosynthesis glyoxalase ElbB [Crocinitomicaceae bacterium]